MFCDEPIIDAYLGEKNRDGFFDIDFVHGGDFLYIDADSRLVLETQHFYVSVDGNKAELDEKNGPIECYARSGESFNRFTYEEWFWQDDEPIVNDGDEFALFKGERIQEVIESYLGYLMVFEDFDLHVIPTTFEHYKEKYAQVYDGLSDEYLPVYGFDRYKNKSCDCGGKIQIYVNVLFVEGNKVQCDKCGKIFTKSNTTVNAVENLNEKNFSGENKTAGCFIYASCCIILFLITSTS